MSATVDPGLQATIGAGQPISPTDRSGTIVKAGQSQILALANPRRKQLIIENPLSAAEQGLNAAENLYVNTGGQAATLTVGNFANLGPGGSVSLVMLVGPGGLVLIDQTTVTVTAATAGHGFNAKEYT